jgi:predicted secreted protein
MQPVRAAMGETFDVRLEGTPTSGYVWELDLRAIPDTVEFISAETITSPGAIAGGPAVQVFRFRAVRPGDAHIRFRYQRRWETEAIRETEITVTVHRPPRAGRTPQDEPGT